MAALELLYLDKTCRQPDALSNTDWTLSQQDATKPSRSGGKAVFKENHSSLAETTPNCDRQYNSVPWTDPSEEGPVCKHDPQGLENDTIKVCCNEELETSFTYVDENVNLQRTVPDESRKGACGPLCQNSANEVRQEAMRDLSMLSDDELASETSEKSVDYGFISAVTFLVTGISLVVISYAVPRDVSVNPDGVSAREMEQLEKESARIGAHLDRCVIAGLCLLTLGGVVLSTLLMISMWKGEMYRRKAFAYSKQSAKLYGSINFRVGSSPLPASPHLSEDEDDGDIFN